MTEGSRNFLTGLAGLGAVAGMVGLLLLFGELGRLTDDRYLVTIQSDHAVGLRSGSSVELHGVPIGNVEDVRTTGRLAFPVVVTARIDRSVPMPKGAIAYATSSLLGGSAILEIDVADVGAAAPMLPMDDTAELEGPIRVRLIEEITDELDARMAPVMKSLARFDELGEQFSRLGRELEDLLAPQTAEERAAGAPPNLRAAVTRAYDVLDTMHEALELARDWLGDETLRTDARTAVTKANTLIDQASETLTAFTTVAQRVESDADRLVTSLTPVADELAVTLTEVRRIAQLATEGDGTVALLLREPDLYRSLDDAARRLEQALREVKLFIEKVKAEGLPVNF